MSTTASATKPAKKTAAKKPAPIAESQPEKKAKKTAPLEAAAALIATLPPGELRDIDPGLIDPHPHNRKVDPKSCAGLASSMKRGQIQPASVRPHPEKPGRFQLGAGCRRWHGAKINGMPLQCLVRDMTDEQIESMLAVENLQRENPDPREEASQIRRLSELPGMTPAEIAAALGKPDAWVQRRMKLTKLINELHTAWLNPDSICHPLPISAMEILASLSPEMQMTFFKEECDDYTEIRTTEDVAGWVRSASCSLKGVEWLNDPATFVPGCGPACANSSADVGLLDFAEFKESKKGGCASCLNSECFKLRSGLARAAQWGREIAAAPAGFIAITDKYPRDDLKISNEVTLKFQQPDKFWDWEKCKKETPGAVLVISESYQGKITQTYMKPPKGVVAKVTTADGESTSTRTPAQTQKASIDRVEGKRYTELLEALVKHVKGLPKDFNTKGLKTPLIPLVAYLGTRERQSCAQDEKKWKDALATTEEEAQKLLWQSVQKVLLERLADRSCTDRKADLIAPKFQAEMRYVAVITGFDFEKEYERIAKSQKLPATLKELDIVTLKKVKAAA